MFIGPVILEVKKAKNEHFQNAKNYRDITYTYSKILPKVQSTTKCTDNNQKYSQQSMFIGPAILAVINKNFHVYIFQLFSKIPKTFP